MRISGWSVIRWRSVDRTRSQDIHHMVEIDLDLEEYNRTLI